MTPPIRTTLLRDPRVTSASLFAGNDDVDADVARRIGHVGEFKRTEGA